jgi:dTDP-4-amino-4,6-dideoxygalactose transaminase
MPISLFNINHYTIDTSNFGNLLHDKVVDDFVKEFCAYVGAKYGCAVNSATNAIFLATEGQKLEVEIPTMIPPVVGNALKLGGNTVSFNDNIKWVGHSYTLHDFGDYKIIDSAQRVDRNQFAQEANDQDLMIFSFYPTKPVGGIDGGILVSNDKDKIEYFKHKSFNGMSFAENNWDRTQISVGWKMYLNSFQAYVALQNLRKLDKKKERLSEIRKRYNFAFDLDNTSDHLYRISIDNRDEVKTHLKSNEITTGIHYQCLHQHPLFSSGVKGLRQSEKEQERTLSLPFHEGLSDAEVDRVIEVIV